MAKKPTRKIGTVVARQPVLERLEGVAELMEESAKAPPVLEAGAEQEDAERPRRDELTQISIRLPREQAARWRSAAREDRQTLSSLILESTERELDRREEERGEPYPESMPEGYKLPRGRRPGG